MRAYFSSNVNTNTSFNIRYFYTLRSSAAGNNNNKTTFVEIRNQIMGPKAEKKRKGVTVVSREEGSDNEEVNNTRKKYQPPLFVEELASFIQKVYPSPSSEWKEDHIEELGKLMANRDGFNSTHKEAIAAASIGGKLNWFFGEYVNLYETNKRFEKIIDPWYVICDGLALLPANAYPNAVNAANQHIGGGLVAGAVDEPIQFNNGRNWFLHCPNRQESQKVASFLHGRINDPAFHTTLIDSRFLLYL